MIASPPLEATEAVIDGVRWTYVFYESGLAINVLYTLEPYGKRAVGFKLSDGMEVPEELAESSSSPGSVRSSRARSAARSS